MLIKFYIYIIILLGSMMLSCGNTIEETQSTIPYVPVDVRVDFDTVDGDLLSLPNTYLYLNGGYKGIVLFHTTGNEYLAYDRACPYDIDKNCALIQVEGIANFEDKCCLTQYNVYGSVIRPPGTVPMQKYSTFLDPNDNILYIRN